MSTALPIVPHRGRRWDGHHVRAGPRPPASRCRRSRSSSGSRSLAGQGDSRPALRRGWPPRAGRPGCPAAAGRGTTRGDAPARRTPGGRPATTSSLNFERRGAPRSCGLGRSRPMVRTPATATSIAITTGSTRVVRVREVGASTGCSGTVGRRPLPLLVPPPAVEATDVTPRRRPAPLRNDLRPYRAGPVSDNQGVLSAEGSLVHYGGE